MTWTSPGANGHGWAALAVLAMVSCSASREVHEVPAPRAAVTAVTSSAPHGAYRRRRLTQASRGVACMLGKQMLRDPRRRNRALLGIPVERGRGWCVRSALRRQEPAPGRRGCGGRGDHLRAHVERSGLKSVATGGIDVTEALKQLTNTMKTVAEMGLAGDVERIELIMTKGAPLKHNDMKIATDGFLVLISTGERVTLKGFKNFVRVIQL